MMWAASIVLTVLFLMLLAGYYWLVLIVGFPAFLVLRELEKDGLLS
jgi:hypothetical protein